MCGFSSFFAPVNHPGAGNLWRGTDFEGRQIIPLRKWGSETQDNHIVYAQNIKTAVGVGRGEVSGKAAGCEMCPAVPGRVMPAGPGAGHQLQRAPGWRLSAEGPPPPTSAPGAQPSCQQPPAFGCWAPVVQTQGHQVGLFLP